jgi:hypothetical protein
MTEKQIVTADFLLKLLLEKGKPLNTDQLSHFGDQQKIEGIDIIHTRSFLVDEGFLRFLGGENYLVELTIEGYKAAGSGIKQYFQLRDERKAEKSITGHNVIINTGNQNSSTITDNSQIYQPGVEPNQKSEMKADKAPVRTKISDWVKIAGEAISAALTFFKLFK